MLELIYTCVLLSVSTNELSSVPATISGLSNQNLAENYSAECLAIQSLNRYNTFVAFRLHYPHGREFYKMDVNLTYSSDYFPVTNTYKTNQQSIIISKNVYHIVKKAVVTCNVTFFPEKVIDEKTDGVMKSFLSYNKQDPKLLMTFQCGPRNITAVTRLMMSLSPVIDVMMNAFNDEARTRTVKIVDFTDTIVEKMVEFCETDKIEETEGDEMELYKIAHTYNIDLMKRFASKLVIDCMNMTNVIELYQFAKTYNNTNLEEKCIEFATLDKLKVLELANIDSVKGEIVKSFWMTVNNPPTEPPPITSTPAPTYLYGGQLGPGNEEEDY